MKIEIPKELWVVKKADSDLAYVTYLEDNEACKKRQTTGRQWAKQYGKSEGIESTHNNELLAGYKILKSVSRWSTSNVVWRVLNPRGFEFEIYSGNMMEILQCSRIENGVILDKCVIGREGGKNVLLPEGSEPYLQAKSYTDAKDNAKESNLKIKDVTPGSLVTLKDGETYTYLGAFYPIVSKGETVGLDRYITFEVDKNKYHYFLWEQEGRTSVQSYRSPTVYKVEPKDSTEDYQKVIHENLEGGTFGVVANRKDAFKLALVEPKEDFKMKYSENTHVYGNCIIRELSGRGYATTKVDISDTKIHFPEYYETYSGWYSSSAHTLRPKKSNEISEAQVDNSLVRGLVLQIGGQNIPLRYIY